MFMAGFSFHKLVLRRLVIVRQISGNREVKFGELKHHVFVFKLLKTGNNVYRAFCAGSIITQERVLTSAHCFLTNRKRRRHNFDTIRVVAGILHVHTERPRYDEVEQWRLIDHLYSQRLFRFPAYDLAIIKVNEPWIFNDFVNRIPYATLDQDFDGVCVGTAVKITTVRNILSKVNLLREVCLSLDVVVCNVKIPQHSRNEQLNIFRAIHKAYDIDTKLSKIPLVNVARELVAVIIIRSHLLGEFGNIRSWSRDRYLYTANFHFTSRLDCEHQLLRSCILYYCTDYDVSMSSSREIEGGGLICHDTGDPAEDEELGILVGVTSMININLPSLHNRVGPFHAWITDDSYKAQFSLHLLFSCVVFHVII